MSPEPTVPTLSRVFSVAVTLGAPVDHGVTSAGHRRVVPILGGFMSGEVDATIDPGGADWQILRDDGAIEIDSRYTARTRDGHNVYVQVSGIRSGDPSVLQSLLSGADVSPDEYYFRTFLRLESSCGELEWLQRTLFVASCVRESAQVRYDAYAVT